jgi:hypothetical protein
MGRDCLLCHEKLKDEKKKQEYKNHYDYYTKPMEETAAAVPTSLQTKRQVNFCNCSDQQVKVDITLLF